jgi:hypothetical protein
MDYWRKKYLIPAIASHKSVALVGIGGPGNYQKLDLAAQVEEWDPMRLHAASIDYMVYDIDSKLVEGCRGLGLNVTLLDVCASRLDRCYDYIFASDVIEHVDNPVSFLTNIRDSLSANGLMVITTPNACFWRQFLSIREYSDHNFAFNTGHFQNLARKLNLKIVELRSFQNKGQANGLLARCRLALHLLFDLIGRSSTLVFAAKRKHDCAD